MFTKKIAVLMIVFIIAMSFESVPMAQAGQPAQGVPHQEFRSGDGLTVSIQATDQDRAMSQSMMTREARMAAKPMPFKGDGGYAAPGGVDRPTGKPGFSSPGAPKDGAKAMAESLYAAERQLAAQSPVFKGPTEFGTAGRYTSYITNWYLEEWDFYPWNTIGKLYFNDGVYGYSCTASLIAWNIVVTAAHCVYDTDYNFWYNGWTFVPAERNYAMPYGGWNWGNATIMTSWMNARNSVVGRKYDMAVIEFPYTDAGGWNVSDYVGYMGYAYNLDSRQSLFAIGYPSNLPDGDAYTYTCAGESFRRGTGILGIGCDMMWGSSGGPWIYGFYPYYYPSGWVNAVVSGGLSGSTWGNTFYGPQFLSTNIVPLCDVIGC